MIGSFITHKERGFGVCATPTGPPLPLLPPSSQGDIKSCFDFCAFSQESWVRVKATPKITSYPPVRPKICKTNGTQRIKEGKFKKKIRFSNLTIQLLFLRTLVILQNPSKAF